MGCHCVSWDRGRNMSSARLGTEWGDVVLLLSDWIWQVRFGDLSKEVDGESRSVVPSHWDPVIRWINQIPGGL